MVRTIESGQGKSRRDVLRALSVAAAGAVASGVFKAEEAEASHGTLNVVSESDKPAVHAENTGAGPGVEVTAQKDGLVCRARDGGVVGISENGYGVYGSSQDASGVYGSSPHFGVWGDAGEVGVYGESRTLPSGVGVSGVTHLRADSDGIGVRGVAWGAGTGVKAEALRDTATALQVEGTAKFSTAGGGTIAARQDAAFVSNPKVTEKSHVTVTLTADPGAVSAGGLSAVVAWVERQPATGFVVHLSRKVTRGTPFTYLIVEPL